MKKILSAVAIAAIFFITAGRATAFSDVLKQNKYYPAINFLEQHNIIKGYSDNTFKPYSTVTRAEFVKIVILSANLKLDVFGSSGFKDINETAWYAPYVRKAKSSGILTGYPDSTFKPEAEISKSEAIKVIGIAQKWKVQAPNKDPFTDVAKDSWFASYVDFAKTKNLIDQSRFFQPDAHITRGLTSDIIYKSDKYNIFKVAATKPEPIQDTNIADNFKPIVSPETPQIGSAEETAFSMISKNSFDNISLDRDFPTQFYKNEIYKFEGSILSSTQYDSMFIFLSYKDQNNTSKTLDFASAVKNNQFSIPVVFRYPGSYEMGIIPGTKGSSKVKRISVLNASITAPGSPISEKPSNAGINFANNKTTVSLEPAQNSLIRITFSQEEKAVSYISRQSIKTFDVPYEDFYDFSPGKINLTVEMAGAASFFPLSLSSYWAGTTISFDATRHLFNKIENQKISVSGLPEKLTAPSKLSITGTAKTEISKKCSIIKPDGLVEEIITESPVKPISINYAEALPKGSSYSISYTPPSAGTYVIGISEITGAAIVNSPVYIGNSIPFLPDFLDIKDMAEINSDLAGVSDKYLNWVNTARQKLSMNPVKIDDSLTILAQKHAEDMAKNNYFSHTDLSGGSPNDRRIALNIPVEVGENIAKTSGLVDGFEGFMRSPAHRKNILTVKWTKVGFGFSKNANGEILTVQEFSPNPLTTEDISKIETELFAYINKNRESQGLKTLNENSAINNITKTWSEKMAAQDFTDFISPDGSTLENMIKNSISYSFVKMFVYSQNTTDSFIENISQLSGMLENQLSQMGLGIAVTNFGNVKATIILTR
ncbi:S-layer homology domain-containing protein [Candidatus Peregrinibacteria bacterium]|nr:S-layer homology domain-containing protein [Candidatus Peregrinibacteria bacterium]